MPIQHKKKRTWKKEKKKNDENDISMPLKKELVIIYFLPTYTI